MFKMWSLFEMSPTKKLSLVVGLAIIGMFYYVWVPPLVQALEFLK